MRDKCGMNAGYMREMSTYSTQSHRVCGDDIWRVLTISKGATREDYPDFSGAIVLIWILISSAGYLGWRKPDLKGKSGQHRMRTLFCLILMASSFRLQVCLVTLRFAFLN